MLCRCGSKQDYSFCCGQFIENNIAAKTPEQLMRSRYVAYTAANIDYIVKTMKGRALRDFNYQLAKERAQSTQWLRLEVVKAYQDSDTLGFVEFNVYYVCNNKEQKVHELSEFYFEGGHWYYIGFSLRNE